MRYIVNDTCIGCGLCTNTCPDYFYMGDEGMAVAKEGDVPDEFVDAALEACEGCPVNAIEREKILYKVYECPIYRHSEE